MDTRAVFKKKTSETHKPQTTMDLNAHDVLDLYASTAPVVESDDHVRLMELFLDALGDAEIQRALRARCDRRCDRRHRPVRLKLAGVRR